MNWDAEMDKPLFIRKGGGFVTLRQAIEAQSSAEKVVEALLEDRPSVPWQTSSEIDKISEQYDGWVRIKGSCGHMIRNVRSIDPNIPTVAVRESCRSCEALLTESPTMKTLEKNKVDLDPDERKKVMTAKAVWPFGKKGADSPAVHKAVVNGKSWYWSSTHRCYHVDPSLSASIKNFFKIVEPSG